MHRIRVETRRTQPTFRRQLQALLGQANLLGIVAEVLDDQPHRTALVEEAEAVQAVLTRS